MKRRMCAWTLILAMLLPVCGAAEALPPSSAMKLLGGEMTDVPADETELAEEQLSAEEMFDLGVAYDFAEGEDRDMEQAIYWYEQAAALGDVRAMFNLGVTYDQGDGVPVDVEQAIYWYEQAAALEYDKAMMNLALIYDQAEYVVSDLEQAIYWY